jgi:hypothetical protein
MIGDGVSLVLCQPHFQPAHDLAGALESEGNSVSQQYENTTRTTLKPLELVGGAESGKNDANIGACLSVRFVP